ncbi:hypothetical protein D8674_006015 [Pyrus ussuriensis x Pyrus communis]|uniref:Uncharacterized protein n=1 Tax=Pyrus ussuriensis x Pyrus communis TaxID=2448454 RepID=A0A5N5FT22_9ROSA|nr:hypothetical protein D8674_006015 [Pyrus ussuriensis x Pyrus communis]
MPIISITTLTHHKVVEENPTEKPGGTIRDSYNLRESKNYAKVRTKKPQYMFVRVLINLVNLVLRIGCTYVCNTDFVRCNLLSTPITPIEKEKMVPYWNVMFDDVEASTDAKLEDGSKGVSDVDQDSEATPLSGPKGKAKNGYHTRMEALPSSS